MNIGVYLRNPIDAFTASSEALKPLRESFPSHSFFEISEIETLEKSVVSFDLLITWIFKKEWYATSKSLKAIFTPAAGSEWIERDPNYSIPVFHGAFHGPLMAETLCAMILFFNKRFHQTIADQSQHLWNRNSYSSLRRLGTQTILFYGYGSIARIAANLLKKIGCTIWAVKRSQRDPLYDNDADMLIDPEHVKDYLCKSDHIVSILPATEQTNNLFNRQFFSLTNSNAYFYNLGRGNCCCETDLLWALNNNRIAGAALDVFESEPLPNDSALWNHPRVLVYPHASAINNDYMNFYISELKRTLKPYLI
jgi:phosphoglycerate dehydrogenase-like enzyme